MAGNDATGTTTITFTTVRPHHAGFGMYQAGPEWDCFGGGMGDFLDHLRESGCTVERDSPATERIDGSVYEQNGGEIMLVTDGFGNQSIYCVRED